MTYWYKLSYEYKLHLQEFHWLDKYLINNQSILQVYCREFYLSRVHCLYHLNPIPKDLLGQLCSVFILPILDVVWTPSSTTHFKQLHARFSHLRSTTCSITLTERRWCHVAIQVYRTLYKLSPLYLHVSFHYAVDIRPHVQLKMLTVYLYQELEPPYQKTVFIFVVHKFGTHLANPTLYTARKLANLKPLYKSLLYM